MLYAVAANRIRVDEELLIALLLLLLHDADIMCGKHLSGLSTDSIAMPAFRATLVQSTDLVPSDTPAHHDCNWHGPERRLLHAGRSHGVGCQRRDGEGYITALAYPWAGWSRDWPRLGCH